MSLFSHTATLHLRPEQEGEDEYGLPIYGPPRDVASPAWWETRTNEEDTLSGEQYQTRYWLYLPEGAPITGADAVTLHGVIDERCEVIGEPGHQPGGFIVDGYARVLLQRVTG